MTQEHEEQVAVIGWAKAHEGKYPELAWLNSSLNGIVIPASPAIAGRIVNYMKSEGGFKKGYPDLFLPVARRGYHGLYIEMKRDETGVVSKEQKDFLAFAEEQGYYDKVCYGADDAIETIEWYLVEDK